MRMLSDSNVQVMNNLRSLEIWYPSTSLLFQTFALLQNCMQLIFQALHICSKVFRSRWPWSLEIKVQSLFDAVFVLLF